MTGRLTAVLHTVRTLTNAATTFNCFVANGIDGKSARVFSQFSFCEKNTQNSQNICFVLWLTVGIKVANLRGLLRIISRTVGCGPAHRYWALHHFIRGLKYNYNYTAFRDIKVYVPAPTHKCNTNEISINNYQNNGSSIWNWHILGHILSQMHFLYSFKLAQWLRLGIFRKQ